MEFVAAGLELYVCPNCSQPMVIMRGHWECANRLCGYHETCCSGPLGDEEGWDE